MFCPKCRYEYTDQVYVCPDCNLKLVAKLPSENEEPVSSTHFVPLPNLPGRVYAEMVKGALERKNIPCYIQAAGIGNAYQFSGTMPLEGVQLYVPEDLLETCIEIQHNMMDHI